MLTFLNSAILFGLAAIAIPILIHLFTRQKTKTILFSSLKFLKELQKQKIRRLKIRQILLLILRTLLILILIFAFARPTLRSSGSSSLAAGAQLTAVIIFDNTLSMGREFEGQKLLDAARKRALEVVDLLRPGDEMYLLYPQDQPIFAHEGPRYSLENIKDLIGQTELSYKKTNYLAAIALANQIMAASSNINKEIYFICDMQKAGLNISENTNGTSLTGDDVNLFVLPVTISNEENLGVTDVSFENQILEQGKVAEIKATIKNYGENAANNKLVHLFVNGKRVGQNVVDLEANSAANVVFRFVPDQTGFQSGFVLLEEDDLIEDNRRFFTFTIPEEIPVLLVGNREQDTYYLNLALRPQKEVSSYLKIEPILARDFAEYNLDNTEVVIVSNVSKFDNAETLKLQKYVSEGGGLMIFLGADVDLRNYNDGLHKRLNLPLLTQSSAKGRGEQFLSFGKIDFSHPIFKGVFEDEKRVESPHIRFTLNVSSKEPLDKIIEYNNGAPFLFESKLQKGRIIYMTTGISEDWSDLIFRGLFVPLVNRSIGYLAGAASVENDETLVGNEVGFASENLASGASLAIKKPDEVEVKIKPGVSKGNYLVRFKNTDQPGIYTLNHNNEIATQWAVNTDPVESENATFTTEELAEALNAKQVYEISQSSDIAEKLNETRFGREFWKFLIMIALSILLIEMVLIKENAVVHNKKIG
ncbi:BatA domain-containing protein [candidate division KSB1 bacterium]|nr:BatA domain-containing protein [candidate division KSB1 bacterium]